MKTTSRLIHQPGCALRRSRLFNQDAGFTLAEMLVALTILALVAGMTTTFLGQLGKVAKIHQNRDVQQQLEQTTRYIERSIETALALPIDISQNENRAFFHGDASQLTFLSAARVGTAEAALRTRQIRMIHSGSRGEIVQTVAMRRFRQRNDAASKPISVTILQEVSGLRFEYLGQSATSPGAVWSEAWTRDRSLPIAVKFTIEATRDGKQYRSSGLAKIQAGGY